MKKNKQYSCIISLLIFFAFSSCTSYSDQKNRPYRSEYFALLPFYESPLTPFRGAYQLDESDAKERIFIKYDFDKENRIVQATLNIGEELKDSEGFMNSLYIQAPKTKVVYNGLEESHFFYDRFDNQISVMDSVFEKKYIKDSTGRNIRLIFLNSNGKQVSDMFGIFSYEWTYQLNGSVIELRKNKDNEIVPLRRDFEFLRTRLTYDPNGYVSTIENVDENGNLINTKNGAAILKYFFDTYGRFSRWEVYDNKNKPAIGPSNTSGENNIFNGVEISGIVFFDTNRNPATHWSGVEQWKFEYDKFGNTTLLSYQDVLGKPKLSVSGCAFTSYTWSKDGRFLLEQSYLDEKKERVKNKFSGVSKIKHIRNDKGLILESHFLDVNDKPISRLSDGVAVIKYEYDQLNRQIAVKKYALDNSELSVS